MQPLCIRCALRLRIAQSRTLTPSKRALSITSSKRKSYGVLPKFTPTSQPELDDVLASLRYKHLLPAALTNSERNLVFKPKYKQQLLDNPEIVTIGGEDIQLEHINRLADIPSLKKEVLPKLINLMAKGEPSDWNQLPAVLAGLKKAKLTPRYDVMGKIARKAIEAGKFGIILQCLHKPAQTEMRLTKAEVLNNVIYALRNMAMADKWSEEATARAIRDANEVAMLLEDEEHGTGKFVRPDDPRTRPAILAVFLELSAVYAWKYQEGKDVDGKVQAYAERLLGNMKAIRRRAEEEEVKVTGVEGGQDKEDVIRVKASMQPETTTPRPTGPQTTILTGVPIYHSLLLSQKILGNEMPEAGLAQTTIDLWHDGLEKLTQGVKDQAVENLRKQRPRFNRRVEEISKKKEGITRWPKSGTYGWQALRVWRSCLVGGGKGKVKPEEEEM